jgi:hypothetical protein
MTNVNSVGIFDFIWSAGFLWALQSIIRGIIQARKRTSRTTGIVVRVPTRWSSGVLVFSPDVEFIDGQGNKHLCKYGYGLSWNEWPIGSQLDVVYDPHDPTNSAIALSRAFIVMWAILIILFLAFGFFQVARTFYGSWRLV